MDVVILLLTWLLGFGQPIDIRRGGQTPPILCIGDDCPSRCLVTASTDSSCHGTERFGRSDAIKEVP